VALLQYAVGTNAVSAIMESVVPAIQAAFRDGATYVVLPELSFLGYHAFRHVHSDAVPLEACGVVRRLAPVARANAGYIVFNHVYRDGPAVHNSSVVLGPWGDVEHTHRKTVLARLDRDRRLTAGNEFATFETRHGRMGILICRAATDIRWQLSPTGAPWNQATARLARLASDAVGSYSNAHLMVLQLAHAGRSHHGKRDRYVTDLLWHSPSSHVDLAAAWAGLTGTPVVLVNKSGYERGNLHSGHSCAVAPGGHLLGAAGYGSGALYVDLPLDADGRIDRDAPPLSPLVRLAQARPDLP
jgi:predicted amidohydrolase